MPDSNAANQQSPFEIVTPGKSKKTGQKGMIVAVLIVVFLILSVVAGVLLVRQQQDIRERASTAICPAAEACPVPGEPTLLRNCHPAESDGSPAESLCSTAGRVEFCGTQNYCCPAPGQAWTTNMTACAGTPTPSPTATATATAAPTASPTATAAASGTPAATAAPTATPTRTPTPTPTSAGTGGAASATPTPTSAGTTGGSSTAQPIPQTGTDWPTFVGAGLGIIVIIASILIAL